MLRWMRVVATSLLRDNYHHSSKLFQFCNFTVSTYFLYSIEVIIHWISVIFFCIYVIFYSNCYSFYSSHKSISVVSKRSVLHFFFFVDVPNKIWVQEVGTQNNRAFGRLTTTSQTTAHGG
jgi:hypothetical protein